MQAKGLSMASAALHTGCKSAVFCLLILRADIRPKGLLHTALLARDREGLSRTLLRGHAWLTDPVAEHRLGRPGLAQPASDGRPASVMHAV